MKSKQLNVVLGIVVAILLVLVGYYVARDSSRTGTLSQTNTSADTNLANGNANTPNPISNSNASTQSAQSTNTQANSNLKSYTNTKYGFSVQYPANATVSVDGRYFTSATKQQVAFSAELGDREESSLQGAKTFNGIEFKKYAEGRSITYTTLKNGVVLAFITDQANVPFMEQIIATFKFTK